ncbi:MAG: biopolymer transporter ExbD [Methylotenera sp.]|nr:biopolymer transporter ExbD [Oligoflexia bacterium]
MAFDVGAGDGDSSGEEGLMSSINVTPFVDVALVLLVIFMVTAPAMVRDTLGIKLPKASAAATAKSPVSLGIAVTRQGQILMNGVIATPDEVGRQVALTLQQNHEAQAIISADADARHGDVVKAIDLIKTAGMERFAIQIEHTP